MLIGRSANRPAPDAILGALGRSIALARLLRMRTRMRRIRPAAARQAEATGTALVVVRQMRCRWCAQTIRSASRHCPICLRPLEPQEIGVFDWPPWRDKDARAIATDLAVPLAFDYAGGIDRSRRRILAEHAFEWAQALYVRGHEARRGQTRSFRLDHMENVIDERTGERLDGVEAIRRALLRTDLRRRAAARKAAAAAEAEAAEKPTAPSRSPAAEPPPGDEPAAAPVRKVNGTAHSVPPVPEGIAPAAEPMAEPADAMTEAEPVLAPASRDIDVIETAMAPAQPAAVGIVLSSARRWLTPAWDGPFEGRHGAPPALVAARRQSAAFARGFVVASSIAIGAAGFLLAERGPGPVAQAPAPPPPQGYDAATRHEMEELIRSLREAAAAATQARAALDAAPTAASAPAIGDIAVPALPSTPLTSEEVRTLQNALLQLGYPLGPVDGIFGARTGAALAAWQNDRQVIRQQRPLRALLFMVQADLAKRHRPADGTAAAVTLR